MLTRPWNEQAVWRNGICPADERARHQPLCDRRRSADGDIRHGQGVEASSRAARRAGRAGSRRLARMLAADWEKAFAFYSALFGWRKSGGHVGLLGAYQGSPPERRRSEECSPSRRHCLTLSGFTISTWRTSRRRRTAWRRAAAKSYMARSKRLAGRGSRIAPILRAQYSRC